MLCLDQPDPQSALLCGDPAHPATLRSTDIGSVQSSYFIGKFNLQTELLPTYTPGEFLELALSVRDSSLPNACGLKILINSHLNIPAFEEMLVDFHGPWPLLGLKYGWPCHTQYFNLCSTYTYVIHYW